MSKRGKLILLIVVFLVGIGMLIISFQHHNITVTGKLILLPHPPTSQYTQTMLVWAVQTDDNRTYYLLDSQKRILGSSEDGALSQYLGLTVTIEGYNITFESYDGTKSYDGLVVEKIDGNKWSG